MVLQADRVSVEKGGRPLLQAVSLQLQPGELVGLIGPNGAGKSTLLRVLAGLQPPTSGHVTLHDKPLTRYSLRERSRCIAWLEQGGSIHWPIPVARLVALGRQPHLPGWQKPALPDQAAIEAALHATDTWSLRHRDATSLSGGERSRVLMARALAANPDILLADEPVAALDPGHQLQTMDLLRHFARNERGCIVVLHELSLAARYCDRLYLLHRGQLAASGTVAEVLSQHNLQQVYGIECHIGCDGVPWIIPLRRL
ncbi:MAG TPA: ABC transporter ATP-binding protein [Thiolinea sp.]|nr:ABC transporter ATP-binding protein [Thiolinea sp.]